MPGHDLSRAAGGGEARIVSGARLRMGRSTTRSMSLSEKKQYRKFTPQQKLELVLASLRGQMSVAEICREHQISETLLRRWREQLLEAGVERFAGKEERAGEQDLRRKIRELERALGRKTYELEVAGEALRGWE